eukprot:6540035-Pyramimonas_sp.AAC.1
MVLNTVSVAAAVIVSRRWDTKGWYGDQRWPLFSLNGHSRRPLIQTGWTASRSLNDGFVDAYGESPRHLRGHFGVSEAILSLRGLFKYQEHPSCRSWGEGRGSGHSPPRKGKKGVGGDR